MTKAKMALMSKISEGASSFEALGFLVWWNVKNIDITQKQFEDILEQCSLDKNHAKEHNYRSAFIRAMRNMEEQRIIRKVSEDSFRLIYQFTAEKLVERTEGISLEYDPETIIVIDKEEYRSSKNFEKSIIKGREDIKLNLIKLFEIEKKRYHSSDITRCLQRILRDEADIISLREQGSVYFVPAGYKQIIDSISALLTAMGGGSSLDFMPVPNVSSARRMVGNAFTTEVRTDIGNLEKELEEFLSGEQNTDREKWNQPRIKKIKALIERVEKYSSIVDESEQNVIMDNLNNIEQRILGKRQITI